MFAVLENYRSASSWQNDHICLKTILTWLLCFSKRTGRILNFTAVRGQGVGIGHHMTHGFCLENNTGGRKVPPTLTWPAYRD